jgi:carbon monoxide dehydrogenase subunit G
MTHTETEITLAPGPDRVWTLLWDLERVVRCLPGCREATTIVPHERYAAVAAQRIGPFNMEIPLDIRVLEAEPLRRLKAEASGREPQTGSALRVVFEFRLSGIPSGTRLMIVSDTEVQGAMGALAQNLIEQKAGGAMTQFAEAVRRELEAAG